MARADRLERMDTRRDQLEADYRTALIAALRDTAAGSWGLFDHAADRILRKKIAPVIDMLAELGEEVDELRDKLDLPPFALQQEFLAARGPVAPSSPGEPKQARAWLERLGEA